MPGPLQRAVTALIGASSPCMIESVDFDDEPHFGSVQVSDESAD
jgi:hypothetical protein